MIAEAISDPHGERWTPSLARIVLTTPPQRIRRWNRPRGAITAARSMKGTERRIARLTARLTRARSGCAGAGSVSQYALPYARFISLSRRAYAATHASP